MIKNQWYAIYPSKKLKTNQPTALKRLNQSLILFRDENNQIGCLKDQCSHRGAALSKGKMKGNCIACPFHGLEFNADGTCNFIPALGQASQNHLERFQVPAYHIKEANDIIYLWYGSDAPSEEPPFFSEEISPDIVYTEIEDHWNAYYSRCIENQLDVIHLPFVHGNTIGRGNKTVVNGPPVTFENGMLKISAVNEVDHGQIPTPNHNLPFAPTYLKFKFPNIWLNHVTDKIRIMIYFAPIDDENTILYIRFYSSISNSRTLNRFIAFFGKHANRIIERQDKRVVITQVPKVSQYHSNEKLLTGDQPIILYRRYRDELTAKAEAGADATTSDLHDN